jgi:PII-like signaling protein
MHGLKGERVLMRIYVEEQDKFQGKPVHTAIIETLFKQRYAGATVLRGTLGFGASSHIHHDHILALRRDDPVIVEVVDTEERIMAILPTLDAMIGGGLITLEKVRVIMYRPRPTTAERDEDTRIDITGSWRIQP